MIRQFKKIAIILLLISAVCAAFVSGDGDRDRILFGIAVILIVGAFSCFSLYKTGNKIKERKFTISWLLKLNVLLSVLLYISAAGLLSLLEIDSIVLAVIVIKYLLLVAVFTIFVFSFLPSVLFSRYHLNRQYNQ